MSSFKLIVSTPDGNKFSGDAAMLSVRGSEGDLAVMPGHIPFITAVKPCVCTIVFEDGSEKKGRTEGGLLTVSNEATTLMTSSFAWSAEEKEE